MSTIGKLLCVAFISALMACSTLIELQPTEATPKAKPEPKIVVIAGHLTEIGNVDGDAEQARFSSPLGIDVDNSGNIFVADTGNQGIRKITPNGKVSTFAGTIIDFREPYEVSHFNNPRDLAIDHNGNVIVADSNNQRIKKITPTGMISIIAGGGSTSSSYLGGKDMGYKPEYSRDGPADQSMLNQPSAVAIDSQGNVIVLEARTGFAPTLIGGFIRKITPDGYVSTVISRETYVSTVKSTTVFNKFPYFTRTNKLAFDSHANLYFADWLIVGKSTPLGELSFIGQIDQQRDHRSEGGYQDGAASQAQFGDIRGLDVDQQDNILVADYKNNAIRKITLDGTVSTLISVEKPRDIAVGQDGTIYVIQGQQIIKMMAWIVQQFMDQVFKIKS